MNKTWALRGVALCAVLLGGCATPPPVSTPPVDPILKSLSESAKKVAAAQMDLSRMVAAKNPAMVPLGPPKGVVLPPELMKPVYLHWNGPIEPAVRSLAMLVNYRVKTVGVAPGVPVLVNIDTDKMSIYDLIQEIGLQAGDAAGVILNPAEKTMTVVWGQQTKAPSGVNAGVSW